MNNPIVLIKDDQIVLRNDINIVDVATGVNLPLHHRLSYYGLIIPLNIRSFTLFNICGTMLGKEKIEQNIIDSLDPEHFRNQLCMIIDRFGGMNLCSKFAIKPLTFAMNHIPYGDGIKLAVTSNQTHNDICHTALKLTNTLEEAFDVICKVEPLTSRHSYRSYRISELIPWIDVCLETGVPIPFVGHSESIMNCSRVSKAITTRIHPYIRY